MCVIAYGYKHHFEREWFEQCCKRNPDGFFVTRVNSGEFIRTLKYEEALDFYDKSKDSDALVLHARIKSVGPVTAANVHGWRAAGMQFCHNGTLHLKIDDDRTDSETMFRDVIVPLFKANKQRFTTKLRRTIEALAGNSKFLIIHKKTVYLFGDFKEKGSCYFSNLYWEPVVTKAGATTPYGYWGARKYDYNYDYYDYDYSGASRSKHGWPLTKPSTPEVLCPHHVLPPFSFVKLLSRKYKDKITPHLLAYSFPAHNWINTTKGASAYTVNAFENNLRMGKVPEEEIKAITTELSRAINEEKNVAVTSTDLRRWFTYYATVVLRAAKEYLPKPEYDRVVGLISRGIRYLEKPIPRERLSAMLTGLPSELRSLFYTSAGSVAYIHPTTTLLQHGVPAATLFYFIYNLHVMINQITTGAGSYMTGKYKQEMAERVTLWVEHYCENPFVMDLFLTPEYTADQTFLLCMYDAPDEVIDASAPVAVPASNTGIFKSGLKLDRVIEALAPDVDDKQETK